MWQEPGTRLWLNLANVFLLEEAKVVTRLLKVNLQQDHYRCPTQSRAALLSHAALRGSEWWAHPCHLHLADCSDTGRWAAWSYPLVALTIRVGDENTLSLAPMRPAYCTLQLWGTTAGASWQMSNAIVPRKG